MTTKQRKPAGKTAKTTEKPTNGVEVRNSPPKQEIQLTPGQQVALERENGRFQSMQMEYLKARVAELTTENAELRATLAELADEAEHPDA